MEPARPAEGEDGRPILGALGVVGLGALLLVANPRLAMALVLVGVSCVVFGHMLPWGGLMNWSIFLFVIVWAVRTAKGRV